MDHESMNLWDEPAVVKARAEAAVAFAQKVKKIQRSSFWKALVCVPLEPFTKRNATKAHKRRRSSVDDASAHPSKVGRTK